jgi:hypothetical protein
MKGLYQQDIFLCRIKFCLILLEVKFYKPSK